MIRLKTILALGTMHEAQRKFFESSAMPRLFIVGNPGGRGVFKGLLDTSPVCIGVDWACDSSKLDASGRIPVDPKIGTVKPIKKPSKKRKR